MIDNYERVCATVDLDCIVENMKNICECVSDNTQVYAVIKADGYGHGAIPIAKETEKIEKVKGYAVATAEEALQLINAGIKKQILVIGYTFSYAYEQMIENNVRITVFRDDTLDELSAIATKLGKTAYVHIKVDTGMGRIGVLPYEDGIELVKKAIDMPGIKVEGVFTHFARADEKDKTSAYEQFEKFTGFIDGIEDMLDFKFEIKHCSNSAAIIEMPDANLDVVRAGIILYGLWPSNEVSRDVLELKPAMRMISHITYIKNIAPGSPISYGGTYVTNKWTRVATIPVGYADGYPRALSNKGSVLIKGQRAPIIGRVCMDQLMVDVTLLSDVNEGDEVVLIGKSGNDCITMEELSSLSDHLNYELACDIGKRVPRLFIKDGVPVYLKDYFEDVPVVKLN